MSLQPQDARGDEERYKSLFASSGLRKSHLVFPVFVSNSSAVIKSMPGVAVTPLDKILKHVQSIADRGISSIIIFGIPKRRDRIGSSALDRNGIVQEAIKEIKSCFG